MSDLSLIGSNFIVHYARGKPFLSITSLAPDLREKTLDLLNEETAWGLRRFSDSQYITRRLEVELHLRSHLIGRGGNPILKHPIYFFLGRHLRFEEHPLNRRYEIMLSEIPKDSITFTYGDTMLSYFSDYRRLSGEKYQNPLCNEIFLLDELDDLLRSSHYPKIDPLHNEVFWEIRLLTGNNLISILVFFQAFISANKNSF